MTSVECDHSNPNAARFLGEVAVAEHGGIDVLRCLVCNCFVLRAWGAGLVAWRAAPTFPELISLIGEK